MPSKSNIIVPLITLALLAGLAAETLSRPRPADAEPFHERVRVASETLPLQIGDWRGEEVPVPPAAIALLKPNVLLSRRYVNEKTGRSAGFLLVQCRDARDMAGHYPPVCYPAHGWQKETEEPVAWEVEGVPMIGMEYAYTRMAEGRVINCVVANAMILPDGRYVREMNEVRLAAADYLRQFYGAAQLQVVLDASVPEEERQAIFRELVGAGLPLLKALGSGK